MSPQRSLSDPEPKLKSPGAPSVPGPQGLQRVHSMCSGT